MTFKREEKDGCALLRIEGPMTVNEASALRNEMVECFNACDGLILDLNDSSDCDTAGIQLMCSARLTAQRTGKHFEVTGTSTCLMDTLARAGFDPGTILGPASKE